MENSRSRGDRYALAALKNKRGTIASEIMALERQIRARKDALSHVDACLRILDPSIEVSDIPRKRPPKHINLFRSGELGRSIIDAIRRNGGSANIKEITTALLESGGHGEEARRAVTLRVRSNLAYQVRKQKVVKEGEGRAAKWRLAHDG